MRDTWIPDTAPDEALRRRVTWIVMLTAASFPLLVALAARAHSVPEILATAWVAAGAAWLARRGTSTHTSRFREPVLAILMGAVLAAPVGALLSRSLSIPALNLLVPAGVLGAQLGFAMLVLGAIAGTSPGPTHDSFAKAVSACGRWLAVLTGFTGSILMVSSAGSEGALALALFTPSLALLAIGRYLRARARRFLERVRAHELPGWALVPSTSVPRTTRRDVRRWDDDAQGTMILVRLPADSHGYRESQPPVEPVALV